MATLGDPTEVDRLALQIEALRAEIRTLESHQKDIATVQSFNTKHLSKFKSEFREEALKQAQIRRGELERLGVSHILPPPNLKTQTTISGQKIRGGRGGEWDAYNNLSPQEKSRLRKNWMSETGHAPDQMALEMGVDSSDQAFETFLNHSRQIDLLEYYGKTGRMPKNFQGYGGKEIDSSFLDHLNIDLRILHDSDLTPTQQLNYLKEQMIGMAELEVDRHLPNGLRPIEDAVSEKYKLDKEYKAHVEAMNADLAQRKASVTTPRTEVQIKLEKIKKAKQTKLDDIARKKERANPAIKGSKPTNIGKKGKQAKPAPKATVKDPKAMLYDDPRTMAYDDSYYGSLLDSGEGFVDEGSEMLTEAFESLSTVRPTSTAKTVAGISSSKKPAVAAAEEAAAKVVKIVESSRPDKALSKLVSRGGEFGPESLRLGALAATLGLGAGYAAGRRHRKR